MRKITSLFQRDPNRRSILDEVSPGAEWVARGEGVATRKWDGTCCLVRDGELYARYDAKNGKTPPPDFEPAQPEADPITGHWPGWVPVGDAPEHRWHREAFSIVPPDGTYELIGPKVQGNPERQDEHYLVPHGKDILADAPRDFEGLRAYLSENDIEGIVWHHPDGRMIKIKAKDFGIKRGAAVRA